MSLFLEKIRNKVMPLIVGAELPRFRDYKSLFTKQIGLEIGGPSQIFKSGQILPVYEVAQRIDGVNFSTQTIWENTIQAGLTYNYGTDKFGYQYILEASNLVGIADGQYDFLLSSHSLEHCANPIKAMIEWQRIIRKGGVMLVALPDKRATFDHHRSITTFEHLLNDYQQNVGEDDQTHVEEILRLHDISRDPGVKNHQQFAARSLQNYENRCLHHHVFDFNLLHSLFNYLGMNVIYTDSFLPSLIILAQKQ